MGESGERRLSPQDLYPKSQQKGEVLIHPQEKARNKSEALAKPTICREILKTFIRSTALSRNFISAYFRKGRGNIN